MAGSLAVLAARVLVLAALSLLLAAPPASAAKRSVPHGFYGANWDGEITLAAPAVTAAHWDKLAAGGVESMRVVFNWWQAQPVRVEPPSFSATDAIVARAAARRIRVLPVVMYAPPWARLYPRQTSSPPARTSDYTAYLAALVRRYGPRGSFWSERPGLPRLPPRHWQIWNEPDLAAHWYRPPGQRWGPSAASRYGGLVRGAYGTLRRLDPGSKLVLAGLANRSWETLKALYRYGRIRGRFDVAAIHPYTSSPERVVTIVKLARQVLRRYGAGRKPIWITEFSWPASKGRVPAPAFARSFVSTDGVLAARLKRAYALLARYRRRRTMGVGRVFWYTAVSAYDGAQVFRYSGLIRFDGARSYPKPAYYSYRSSARGHQGCVKTRTGLCLGSRG
jgi:hypothetical protein